MAQNMNLFMRTTKMPLTENVNRREKRMASPEIQRNPINKSKLRRSKSHSELNNVLSKHSSLKRQATTFLNLIPEKIAKTNTTTGIGARSKPQTSTAGTSAGTIGRTTKPIIIANRKPLGTTSATAAANKKPVAASTKSATTTKTTGGTAAAAASSVAPAKKKIPPYDMKARFYDLQEKHIALKEKYQQIELQLGDLKNLPAKYDAAEKEIIEKTEEIINLKVTVDDLTKKNISQGSNITSLLSTLRETSTNLHTTKEELKDITTKYDNINEKFQKLDNKVQQLSTENEALKIDLNYMSEIAFKANIERKDLHNQVMDLRGNIRVFCRVRPPLKFEEDRSICNWSYLDESSLEVSSIEELPSGARVKPLKYEFNFDQIFHQHSMQEDIFECVSPLIQSALDGYNVCIFAYGQTGSGKFYFIISIFQFF